MCTVSWTLDRVGGYQLFFNRDEQRSRPRAKPPQLFERDGRRVVAPIDEKSGGSWIAVNDLGVCAFLLNNYEAMERTGGAQAPFKSRGEIPILLCSQNGFDQSFDTMKRLEPHRFPPFFAGLIGPEEECRIFCWDGLSLQERSLDLPFLTTSSFQSTAVQSYRRNRFLEFCGADGALPSPASLSEFHRDLANKKRAFNPLMSRSDAETHCISSISVEHRAIIFEYQEIDPADGKLLQPTLTELI